MGSKSPPPSYNASGLEKTEEPKLQVTLIVGGEVYVSFFDTLTKYPQSNLAAMVNELSLKCQKGEPIKIFIDRDRNAFRWILGFLHDGVDTVLPLENKNEMRVLWKEADFFGLEEMKELIAKEQPLARGTVTFRTFYSENAALYKQLHHALMRKESQISAVCTQSHECPKCNNPCAIESESHHCSKCHPVLKIYKQICGPGYSCKVCGSAGSSPTYDKLIEMATSTLDTKFFDLKVSILLEKYPGSKMAIAVGENRNAEIDFGRILVIDEKGEVFWFDKTTFVYLEDSETIEILKDLGGF